MKRAIAAAEVLLISPSALFMAALFVRNIQPQQFEPAHTAQRIVMWYAASAHVGLWIFLMLFPLAVFAIGCATLVRAWQQDERLRLASHQALTIVRTHFATLVVAMATISAAAVLAIVAIHAATD